MSIRHCPVKPILISDLFDGRLEKRGIHEHTHAETTPNRRCLTDGNFDLWVYAGEDGLVKFVVYARLPTLPPKPVVASIEQEFDTRMQLEFLLRSVELSDEEESRIMDDALDYACMTRFARGQKL